MPFISKSTGIPTVDKVFKEVFAILNRFQGGKVASSSDEPVDWADIVNKPTTFPPESHTQDISTINNLQTALDSKEPVIALGTGNKYLFRDKTWKEVDWSEIINKPSTYSPTSHIHAIADITSLQTTLDGKQPVHANLTSISNLSTTPSGRFLVTNGSAIVARPLQNSDLPAIAITDTFVVASQSAMLALSAAERGDVAVRTDLNKSFILKGDNPASLSDWQELLTPTDAVLSVDGRTGVVSLADKYQPLDSDLTVIAGLTHSNRHVMVSNGSSWTRRALEEADLPSLSISKITGLQTALDSKEPAITGTANKVLSIQADGSGVKTGSISDDGNVVHFEKAFIGNSASPGIRHYHDVYLYSNSNATETGILKIVMPQGWTNTFQRITIKGYNYKGDQGAWECIIGGYNYTEGWYNYSAEIRGSAPFSIVRLGYDGSKCVILLGTTETVWRYAKVAISDMLVGGSIYGWETGWSASIITSETGLTKIVAPTVNSGVGADWNALINKPSTFTPSTHGHPWGDITGKPSAFAPAAHSHAIADVTSLQTTLDGKQPLNTNLTAIAGLTHSNRHVLISDGSTWTRRALVEADIPVLSSAKLPSNIVYTDNTQTISGAKTFSANATFAGPIIGSGSAGLRIVNNTTDGSDTKTLLLCGGGSYQSTRGATIALRGNESTDGYGNLELTAGDGNGTITGAVRVNPRMYFGTRPANDHRWTLALDNYNTFYSGVTFMNIMHNLYHDGSNWRYRYGSGSNSGGVNTTLAYNYFGVSVAGDGVADQIATLTPAIRTNLSGNTAFGKDGFVGGYRLEVEGNTLISGILTAGWVTASSGADITTLQIHDKIQLLNKARTGWLDFVTRDVSGSEAAANLSNVARLNDMNVYESGFYRNDGNISIYGNRINMSRRNVGGAAIINITTNPQIIDLNDYPRVSRFDITTSMAGAPIVYFKNAIPGDEIFVKIVKSGPYPSEYDMALGWNIDPGDGTWMRYATKRYFHLICEGTATAGGITANTWWIAGVHGLYQP